MARFAPKASSEVPSQANQAKDAPEVDETPDAPEPENAVESPSAEKHDDVNLDDLSDEEIAELAQKGKSRLLKRIAKLTAKAKLAEEQARRAQEEINRYQSGNAIQAKAEPENNPYDNLQSVEELQKAMADAEKLIEEADEILWRNEHMAADDVVYEENGKPYTKAEIRQIKKAAEKAKKEYIPSRHNRIQEAVQRKMQRQQLEAQARQELSWMDDNESDANVFYKGVMDGPIVKKILEKVPEAEPFMPYLVAHASNSVKGRKEIALVDKKPAVKPPAIGAPNGGSPSPEAPAKRKVKEMKDRATKSGDRMDFQKARAAELKERLSQRR